MDWYMQNPEDWRATRLAIKEKYWNGEYGGPGGSNGYRTITAATIGALLYGQGDFVESIRFGFNFGWDADNVTAMIGTIIGVIKGEKWIREQGWIIKDSYINDRRPGLPAQMTIGEFSEMHLDLAKINIISNDGLEFDKDGDLFYRINIEEPDVVEKIPVPLHRHDELLSELKPAVFEGLKGDSTSQAAAIYLAVCLGIGPELERHMEEEWRKAIASFMPYYGNLFAQQMWSKQARDYFMAVIVNGNTEAEYPLGPQHKIPN
jgi:hypothetical protein